MVVLSKLMSTSTLLVPSNQKGLVKAKFGALPVWVRAVKTVVQPSVSQAAPSIVVRGLSFMRMLKLLMSGLPLAAMVKEMAPSQPGAPPSSSAV